jgi:serine/threonine protein kinase
VDRGAVTVTKTLGEGEFGLVQLGVLDVSVIRDQQVVNWILLHQTRFQASASSSTSIKVAVKCIHEDQPLSAVGEFETEARLLSAFSHPNIVKVLAVCFKSAPAFIALELMAGDLLSYLTEHSAQLKNEIQVQDCNSSYVFLKKIEFVNFQVSEK